MTQPAGVTLCEFYDCARLVADRQRDDEQGIGDGIIYAFQFATL